MIRSMTAFSRHTAETAWGSLVWEIRSVNHRYFEPGFKLPENVRAQEHSLRDILRNHLDRGKIECNLRIQWHAGNKQQLTINRELLSQLIAAGEAVQHQLKEPGGINPLQLLQWPGVISEAEIDNEQINAQVLSSFQSALKQLIDTREREGEQLKHFVLQRLDGIAGITTAVRQQLPLILQAQRDRLRERLEAFKVDLDPERLEQEMVLLVQKADVAEELDRLDAHIAEVQRVIQQGGACGRRLDFLMQELNREANTLSSKSVVSDTTQAAVELKVLIEQMREQIQNIE